MYEIEGRSDKDSDGIFRVFSFFATKFFINICVHVYSMYECACTHLSIYVRMYIYGLYIWMYVFRYCVKKRACMSIHMLIILQLMNIEKKKLIFKTPTYSIYNQCAVSLLWLSPYSAVSNNISSIVIFETAFIRRSIRGNFLACFNCLQRLKRNRSPPNQI